MAFAPTTTDADTKKDLVHLILTGASGYLGQHLLAHWIRNGLPKDVTKHEPRVQITALCHSSKTFSKSVLDFCDSQDLNAIQNVTIRSMDLTNRKQIQSFVESALLVYKSDGFSTTNIIVHAAALTNPFQCEKDPVRTMATNVPAPFFDAFVQASTSFAAKTAIIALSTEYVYDGHPRNPHYDYQETNTNDMNPVGVYGQSKLELEHLLQKIVTRPDINNLTCFALRSSLILGPTAPIDASCAHSTFLDFCKSRGQDQTETEFFTNEYRCVVRVDRILEIIQKIIGSRVLKDSSNQIQPFVVYNMGGPVRVNRMDIAKAVFEKFGYDPKLLLEGIRTSTWSPFDASMDSSLLFRDGILSPSNEDDYSTNARVYLRALVDYAFSP